MDRKRFPNISKDAFQAETDRKALEALKKIPVLPTLVKKFYEIGADRWMYCFNMATSVRCSPNQFGTLDAILDECCEILDMPKPELYVSSNPFPNAFAGGIERPYITIRSSMIDTLSDEQLYHLVGHELGHIKCGHVLYKSIAMIILPLLELVSRRTFGLGDAAQWALLAAFYEWSRQAEISCDRAGLLCSQDFDLSSTGMLRLTHGPNRLSGEASVEAFLDQARTYQDMEMSDAVGKIMLFLMHGMLATHPLPVHRMQALDKWHTEGYFDKILKGQYPHVDIAAS